MSALAVAIVAALVFWRLMPERVPVVESITQLTNDRQPKGNLVTDGLRIYFEVELSNGIAQVAVSGGQTANLANLPTKPGEGLCIGAITPDLSGLLVVTDNSLWLLPLPAGEPRKLTLKTNPSSAASFFPDGRIVWTMGPTVSIAQKDGSSPRKLTDVPGMAERPVVSPDGRRIRLTVIDDQLHSSIWEMQSDGTGLHQLLKGWPGSLSQQGDGWTPDGNYFVFHSLGSGRSDLWVLPEHKSLLGRTPSPMPLTHGPISFEMPKPSPDGRKLYAVGSALRGELVHYDARIRQFVPYLSGMSAIQSTVSRGGKWIAYVSFPDHALWRANADGSGRVQLTFPPMMVFYPQISPDGTRIAFSGLTETGLGLFVLWKDSGKIEKLADFGHSPMWSPDGNSLAFAAMVSGKRFWDEPPWCEIHTIDLRTRKITVIADPSGSRYAPWWPSPTQIIAMGVEDGTYHLYDFNTRKWTPVGHPIDLGSWTPSSDGTSLYLLEDSPELAVFRMRTPDFHVEKVADVAGIRITYEDSLGSISSGHWIGVAADGSPVVTRDVGSDEIYALDVKWP